MIRDLSIDPQVEAEEAAKQQAEADAAAQAEAAQQAAEAEAAAKAAADAEREEALRRSEQQNADLLQAYLAAVQQGQTPSKAQAAAAEQATESTPGWEEDPEAYINTKIQQGVSQGIQQAIQPLTQQYHADRSLNLNTAIEAERARMRADAAQYPMYAELEDEIRQYEQNYQPDELAKPGALAEAYFRVMGRKNAADFAAKQIREQGPDIDGRSGESQFGAPPQQSSLSDREAFFARKDGLRADDFKNLQGARGVTIDDWKRMQAKRGA